MIDSELPTLSVTMQGWLDSTSLLFRQRGTELQEIDRTLQNYLRAPSAVTLKDLQIAFTKWKFRKTFEYGEWKKSARNSPGKGRPVEALDDDLFSRSQYTASATHARLGVLYLLSNLHCEYSSFAFCTEGVLENVFSFASNGLTLRGLETASGIVEAAGGAVTKATASTIEMTPEVREWRSKFRESRRVLTFDQLARDLPALPSSAPALKRIVDAVKQFFSNLLTRIEASIRAHFDSARSVVQFAGKNLLELSPTIARQLVDNLTKAYCANIAPIIGGAWDITSSALDTAASIQLKVSEYLASKTVSVRPGMSTALLDAIRNAMTVDISKGAYGMFKGATKLALDVATQGIATSVYSIVVSAIEILVQFVYRWYQISAMNQMFETARAQWDKRALPDSIHLSPGNFNAWFGGYVRYLPPIAALVLNSGLCVDKTTFYTLVKDDVPVAQSAFDSAGAHMQGLRSYSSTYLEEAKFKLTSQDELVAKSIEPAEAGEASGLQKVIETLQTAVGG